MVFMADFLFRALAQLFVIVRHEQLAKCCFRIGYKKCDVKTIEVWRAEQDKIQRILRHEKTGFYLVWIF